MEWIFMGTRTTSLDRLFGVLTEQRRRYVLYYVSEEETQIHTLDDLAAQLCSWEREWDDRTDQAQDTHEANIRIDLHHVHLPKLTDVGLIDYDARSYTARSRVGDSLHDVVRYNGHEFPKLDALFIDVKVKS